MTTSRIIRIAGLACLAVTLGCKPGVRISSSNQPKSDSEALAMVGITMTPPPKVEYQFFQPGMDDHLDLVIRFPKNRVDEFWEGSKWIREDSKSLEEQRQRMREIYERRIKQIAPGRKDPVLESLRKSTEGIWCDEPAGSREGLKVFLSLDQDPEDVIAYIEWFQT